MSGALLGTVTVVDKGIVGRRFGHHMPWVVGVVGSGGQVGGL